MIPRAHITAWRDVAPWADDAQVEQDLALSRGVSEIYSDAALATGLAFRGGTALHKLFLRPPVRYSEDIDLVQTAPSPIGPQISALRRLLDPWLGEPRRRRNEIGWTLTYAFESEIPPIVRLRLKVEINTREHFSVFGLERRQFDVDSPWFSGSSEIVTYSLEELLGTKLRALYQRKKGRDLFDLWLALDRTAVDDARVVSCFLKYMEHGGTPVSRAEFEANLHEKMSDRGFTEEAHPLLATGISYDPSTAHTVVQARLISLLPGAPWKGRPGSDSPRQAG